MTVAEYILYTGVSSNELTGVTRGFESSTGRTHGNGATVVSVMSISHINRLSDKLRGVDAVAVEDVHGNEVLKTAHNDSAVNEITITNAATGNAPQIAPTGSDTDIDLKLDGKGAGEILLNRGFYQGFQAYTPAGGATATLDLSLGNDHRITMPAGNITIAISNAKVGQKFLISITQDSGGSRTVTWFTTLKWAGGAAPTLTTTANKRDTFGFIVTSAGNYDGFIVGQNV